MSTAPQHTVTELLAQIRAGDRGALDRLFSLVYSALKQVSRAQLRPGRGVDFATTELVHETYLKLLGADRVDCEGRSHFLAVAARVMRQVLVDQARSRLRQKRGGGEVPVTLDDRDGACRMGPEELLAFDEAIERLDALSPRLRQVVELKFFGGMSEQEIAEALEVTPRTVARDWVKAKLVLHHHLVPHHGERVGA